MPVMCPESISDRVGQWGGTTLRLGVETGEAQDRGGDGVGTRARAGDGVVVGVRDQGPGDVQVVEARCGQPLLVVEGLRLVEDAALRVDEGDRAAQGLEGAA